MGLLREILDPNRAVDQRFAEYIAITSDGLVKNGILADEGLNLGVANSISLIVWLTVAIYWLASLAMPSLASIQGLWAPVALAAWACGGDPEAPQPAGWDCRVGRCLPGACGVGRGSSKLAGWAGAARSLPGVVQAAGGILLAHPSTGGNLLPSSIAQRAFPYPGRILATNAHRLGTLALKVQFKDVTAHIPPLVES